MSIIPTDYERGMNDMAQDAGLFPISPDELVVADIAKRCANLRSARGLSLQEAGDRAGFTKSHMWEFEQGRSRNPTIRMLLGLARAYGVSLSYLIGHQAETPPLLPEAMRIAGDVDALLRKARS